MISECRDEKDYYNPESFSFVLKSKKSLELIRSFIERAEVTYDFTDTSIMWFPNIANKDTYIGNRSCFDARYITSIFAEDGYLIFKYTEDDIEKFTNYLKGFSD